jgi:hypothetical protein
MSAARDLDFWKFPISGKWQRHCAQAMHFDQKRSQEFSAWPSVVGWLLSYDFSICSLQTSRSFTRWKVGRLATLSSNIPTAVEPEAGIGNCCPEAVLQRAEFPITVILNNLSVALDCPSAAKDIQE